MNQMYKFLLTVLWLYISTSESAELYASSCNDDTKTDNTTQLSRNIDALLHGLVQGAAQKGFLTASYGNGVNQIYGLAQCRADVSGSDCSVCLRDAANQSRKLCPNQADVRIWYDYCFLKYDTAKFFGQVDTSYGVFFWNVANVTDPDVFNKKLSTLVDQIKSEAVKLPGSRGLGKGETEISAFETLYALVQCTRDLSPINCAQCLSVAIGNFGTYCNDKKGCRVLYGSCYVRYELYPFFFPLDAQGSLAYNAAKYESVKVYKP
ncbi:cysteine-rich repeat secretory protein 55-like [Dorcoceras hygrometricum]|uniref:Cysteine-rich repeat secretory protein 55-like n=1 Tax=Dorcoceras hygrometricum TaxID=472368 RepID=A0A2Z7AWG3_9LAMI|nr:cysteine-rich repeat secretory protein 55-like [Dorcoceras hygrometricum]